MMSVHASGFRDILQAAAHSLKGLLTARKPESTRKTHVFLPNENTVVVKVPDQQCQDFRLEEKSLSVSNVINIM